MPRRGTSPPLVLASASLDMRSGWTQERDWLAAAADLARRSEISKPTEDRSKPLSERRRRADPSHGIRSGHLNISRVVADLRSEITHGPPPGRS